MLALKIYNVLLKNVLLILVILLINAIYLIIVVAYCSCFLCKINIFNSNILFFQ